MTEPVAAAVPPPARPSNPRARFSGKRLIVGTLASAVVGSLASLGVYSATCDGNGCIGPAVLALVANLSVTPLVAWGTGSAMGGEGTLGSTYLYGLGGSGLGLIQPPELGLALVIAFLPLTSALGYELSSHRWYNEHHGSLTVAPVTGGGQGAMATLSLRF